MKKVYFCKLIGKQGAYAYNYMFNLLRLPVHVPYLDEEMTINAFNYIPTRHALRIRQYVLENTSRHKAQQNYFVNSEISRDFFARITLKDIFAT